MPAYRLQSTHTHTHTHTHIMCWPSSDHGYLAGDECWILCLQN